MPSFGPAYGQAQSTAFRAAERVCARTTSAFISVGAEMRDLYLDAGIGAPNRHLVIPSPVEVERFLGLRQIPRDQRATWRMQYGVSDQRPILISVGALDKRKRHDLIIRRLAARLRAGAHLLVAGEGPEEGNLRQLVAEAGLSDSVALLGFVPDPISVFGAADVLVHASTTEGVPQTVIQGLAAGLPVVATAMEGLREFSGHVVGASASGDDLADAVDKALAERRRFPAAEQMNKWTPAGVRQQHARLQDAVENALGSHRPTRAPLPILASGLAA
jgi:glycosyltransferase involved in cell wall biosynthesis